MLVIKRERPARVGEHQRVIDKKKFSRLHGYMLHFLYKILQSLFKFCVLPVCLTAQDIQLIDFCSAISNYDLENQDAWSLGYLAFNYSPELIPFFAQLQQKYDLSVAIETGTQEGRTTALLARLFDQVHTIEFDANRYHSVRKKLNAFPNVNCLWGDSGVLLTEILAQHKSDRVFFYLDAHGGDSWPLLSELNSISQSHKDNCMIVIDDFKVPGRLDISYDAYTEGECSFEYIHNSLDKIFTEYECCIVIPKKIDWRAKFVAFPKKWIEPVKK